ncbi:MAG: tRNA 2-thiouridine(34) synthase MnmA [Armatimonadetes bacterium]|nr:tRNA 2-thiouridine(34) synthase MnmA [Armatimonadota bacterium]
MSGGVDSAVTAALLHEAGFDVIGVTLQIWQEHAQTSHAGGCCSLGAVEDARRAATRIGIPHYVFNYRETFAQKVIERFTREYAAGRTPNPCIECNRTVKFDELRRQSLELGAEYLATGHYTRVRRNGTTGRYELLRARNEAKDQSYALYTLTQEQLERTIMPLGELESKSQTRRLALELGLALANKPESQEICFVPAEGYTHYLKQHAPETMTPGSIVDTSGRELGRHDGIALYTIGQRKRIKVANREPLYVVAIDAPTATVVVGTNDEVYSRGLLAKDANWIPYPRLNQPIATQVKIRYNGAGALAHVVPAEGEPGNFEVHFDEPQRAVTPGQAAVLYQADLVVGGGTIEKAI